MIVAGLLMILRGCLSTSSAGAEDDEAGGWEYSVTPFLWAPSVKGDVTVRGRSSSVDASFKDIVEQSDSILAYFSHFEARNGRLALFAEPSYMDIGMSENAKVGALKLDADVTSTLLFFEVGGAYRVLEWNQAAAQEAPSGGTVELLAGARYTDIDGKIDLKASGLPPDF